MEKGKEKNLEKMIENLGDQMVKGFTDADEKIIKLIEDLTSSTAAGFLGVHKKFDLIDDKFDKIDQHFDNVETRLGGVETRLDGVEVRLGGVETRLDGVEVRLGGVETKLSGVEGEVTGLKTNMITLFSWVKKIDKDLEAANAKLDKLAGRIEKNEAENKALVIEVQRIDKELIKIKKILKIA